MSVAQSEIRPVFSHDIFTLQEIGGVSRYYCDLHLALREAGIRSTVLAPLHANRLLAKTKPVLGVFISKRILKLPAAPGLMKLANRLVERRGPALLARRRRGFVHHQTYYSALPPSPKYANAITVYDMIHERYPAFYPPADRTREHKRLWCERADVVIAISDNTKSELVQLLGIDPERVVVCHLGVTRVEPDPATRDVLNGSQPFLLYVGSRRRYKNFLPLVAAFSRSRAARDGMRLIAFGEEQPTPEELSSLVEHRVAHLVSFVGGDDATLAAYYATASGLLYPSLDEGFGLPPLEAMNHGCPVAASDAGAIPEVVSDAALLFDPLDAESMTTAIDSLIYDDALRERLVSRGTARVSVFTWEAAVRRTLVAYATALDRAKSRS